MIVHVGGHHDYNRAIRLWDWPEAARDQAPLLAEFDKLPVRAAFDATR